MRIQPLTRSFESLLITCFVVSLRKFNLNPPFILWYESMCHNMRLIYLFSHSHLLLFASLAEALDVQPPVMPDDGHATRVTTGSDASSSASAKEASVLEPVWDDEDTRAFYESLPDLRFVC